MTRASTGTRLACGSITWRWALPIAIALALPLLTLVPSPAQVPSNPAAKKDLLTTAPFDRLTLIDNTTWDIEPINPRPFVLFDPRKTKKRKVQSVQEAIREGGNITAEGAVKSKMVTPDTEAEPPIRIRMIEGEMRDYDVKHEHIKAVEHFEDMLLAEIDRLTNLHDFTKAFEYLLYLQSRAPSWKGLQERVEKLQFEEGSTALLDGDGERGLRLLGDLYAHRPDFPGLAEKLAGSYANRVLKAFNVGNYAKGRQVLRELTALAPDNLLTREARDKFVSAAQQLIRKADAEKEIGAKVDDLTEAARIWPSYDGLESKYTEAFTAQPTLDVAVADLPRPIAPWRRSAAAERVARLLYLPLLASMSEQAIKGDVAGQLAAGFETFDLARGLRVRIKPGFTWSDGSRPVSAVDVARALADRAVPSSPGYSARWGDLLQKVEITEDNVVELHLARACLRPEAWLVEPVGPAHAGWDGWVVVVGKGRWPVGDGMFVWESSSRKTDVYRSASDKFKIRRLREITYPSSSAAVAAFLRGETTLIESLPVDRVAEIGAQPGIKIGTYDHASLHRIALDGRNPAIRLRSLRRALSLAIDRKTLLTESVLRRPADAANAVADGPFLKGTYADAPDVPELTYDPLLAKMLATAAKAERGGGIIRLTFEYPPTPEARAVCPKIVEAWKAAGIDIIPKETPQAELEARLRSGAKFDLAYLSSRPLDPTLDAGTLICPGYDASPSTDPLASVASPRILQLLLELDRAPEANTARSLAMQIDRESRDELPMIPLWQIEEHYAWRDRLKGIKPTAGHLYDQIETWEIEPWFAKDPQ